MAGKTGMITLRPMTADDVPAVAAIERVTLFDALVGADLRR